jgi:F-type H+-transporting ATPase subunit delta
VIANVVARRYAKAIVALGVETGELEGLVDQLGRAAEAWRASAELRRAIETPTVPAAAKQAILRDLADRLGLGPLARNTVLLLADRRRVRALPEIAAAVRDLAEARRGVVRAEVLAARPLSEDYLGKLRAQLERMTGKRIALDCKDDPSLLAGVIVRIGDTVYDGSLRSRLDGLRSRLVN